MHISAITTRPLVPPQDDLRAVLAEALPETIPERSVLVVRSKVVAISEGRCVPIPAGADVAQLRHKLAQQEASMYVPKDDTAPHARLFTIVHGTLISSAGIDQSNGDGHLILWPKDPMAAARTWRAHVQTLRSVAELGVIISDSHSTPLRNGALGLCIGYAGVRAQRDYRGIGDIFGRKLQFERLNLVDSLAAAANVVMGEGNECTPLALVTDVPGVVWSDAESADPVLGLHVAMEDDVFAPFLTRAPWQTHTDRTYDRHESSSD